MLELLFRYLYKAYIMYFYISIQKQSWIMKNMTSLFQNSQKLKIKCWLTQFWTFIFCYNSAAVSDRWLSFLINVCELMYFYFIKPFAAFSVIFSQIISQKINFLSKFSIVTQILEFSVSLVSPCISLSAETRMYGRIWLFAYVMRIREISLRHVDL